MAENSLFSYVDKSILRKDLGKQYTVLTASGSCRTTATQMEGSVPDGRPAMIIVSAGLPVKKILREELVYHFANRVLSYGKRNQREITFENLFWKPE